MISGGQTRKRYGCETRFCRRYRRTYRYKTPVGSIFCFSFFFSHTNLNRWWISFVSALVKALSIVLLGICSTPTMPPDPAIPPGPTMPPNRADSEGASRKRKNRHGEVIATRLPVELHSTNRTGSAAINFETSNGTHRPTVSTCTLSFSRVTVHLQMSSITRRA